jgi:hypothetical protein
MRAQRKSVHKLIAMKMNGTGMRIGVTVLALGVSLLAIPTLLEAQKAARISRVGWLEVCGPGLGAPISIFSGRVWRKKATSRGRTSSSSSDSQIADTTGCRG